MTDDLYNKAISFYNKGEYEEALDAIRSSSMATSKESLSLIRECEKLILEQHVYLINEYIEQRDYLNALRKKEEYRTKYGLNPKIENIIIPYASVVVDQKECSEHQTSNNQSQQSVKRKLPLYRKLFCMKRMGLIIIAIIVLGLISLLEYRSYKSTGELQKKRLYEDSIRVADSIAAIEAAEEEYQRQMAIEKEQEEFGLEVSNDVPNPTVGSTIIGFEYYGMINEKYPIVMNLAWREPNEIGGSYYYVKNGSNNTLELSGSMNSNDYMVLKEYNSAGENTGTFEGKWSSNSYSGTFTNYKGVKMPFKLYSETTATNDSDIIFNSYQKSNASSVSNSLSSFFSKNVGKYPSDINLLEFPLLKTRLIALVGNNNYNFIKTYFQVVTPIKIGFNKNPNLYEVSGGEEHNCMSNNTTIVYNQQLDNLTVQLIKEGSDPFIFQEKKDDSPFE